MSVYIKAVFSIMALYPPCKRGTGNDPYKAFVATFAPGVDPGAVRAIAQYFALTIETPYDSDCKHVAGHSPGAAVSSTQIRSEPKSHPEERVREAIQDPGAGSDRAHQFRNGDCA